MTRPPLFVGDLAACGLIAVAAFAVGRRLTARLSFASALERVAVSLPLGLGSLGTALFAVGVAGAFRRAVVGGVLVLALLAGWPVWRRWPSRWSDAWRRIREDPGGAWLRAAAVAVGLVAFIPCVILALYPPTPSDATSFHLAVPKAQLAGGRVELTPFLRYPVFPLLQEMTFAAALALGSDVAAQLLQCLAMLVTAALVFQWGRRLASPAAGAVAAGFWLGSPMAVRFGTVAYVDVGLTMFVCAAVYAWSRSIEDGGPGWLVLAGAFTGFAAGSKYTALFFGGVLTLATLWRAVRARRWWTALAFGIPAAVIAAPWYAYNAAYTGNPVFPFFGGVFGHGPWMAEDLTWQLAEMRGYGLGRTPTAFLQLLWNMARHPEAFHQEAALWPFALLLPASLLGAAAVRETRFLLALAVAYAAFWFASVQVARYLMPVIPLVAVAVGVGVGVALRWLRWPRGRRATGALALLLFAVTAFPGWSFARAQLRGLGRLPTTPRARHAFLSLQTPSYPAYRLLNERRGAAYRLYQLSDEGMAYFADGTFMGDWFGPARYARVMPMLGDSRRLHGALTDLGADHFLIWLNRSGGDARLPTDSFFEQHFRPLYAQGPVHLFEVLP